MKCPCAMVRHLLGVCLLGLSLNAAAQLRPPTPEEMECGPLTRPDAVPPMDYRTDRKLLVTVEWGHFRPNVEFLIKPMFDHFGSDLSYTLHAYPNHPRALATLIRLGERDRTDQPQGMPYTIDCFFRRAVKWRADDLTVRMLYSEYLNKKGRLPDAMAQLDYASSVVDDNPFTHYNLGLHFLELKAYDKALLHAHRAQEGGFDIKELKNRLVAAGQWRDPAAPTTAAADAAPAAASAATAAPVRSQ